MLNVSRVTDMQSILSGIYNSVASYKTHATLYVKPTVSRLNSILTVKHLVNGTKCRRFCRCLICNVMQRHLQRLNIIITSSYAVALQAFKALQFNRATQRCTVAHHPFRGVHCNACTGFDFETIRRRDEETEFTYRTL